MTITFENTSFNQNELKKKFGGLRGLKNDFWAIWLEFFEWGIRKNWSHGDEDHTLSLQICKSVRECPKICQIPTKFPMVFVTTTQKSI